MGLRYKKAVTLASIPVAQQTNLACVACDSPADSHFYASKHGTEPEPGQPPLAVDESEMMMVKLLLGRVVTIDRDESDEVSEAARSLKVPPFVDAKPPLYQDGDGPEKFDTVSGFTQTDVRKPNGQWEKNCACPKSQVWIVYENGRAYPEYVVRYYRAAARDPTRTPFATRAEALVPPEGIPLA